MPRVIQTALATLLTSIALQTTAFAASVAELADAAQLQVRDVDQDGVADAYYSTALNLTWLADANLAATTGAAPYGLFNKDEADKWAQDASPWGVTGWRLPSIIQNGGALDCYSYLYGATADACAAPVAPGSSELAYLYTSLAASGATSLFQNIQNGYWQRDSLQAIEINGETVFVEMPSAILAGMRGGRSWHFDWAQGENQLISSASNVGSRVWLVHDGDILSAVPEPSAFAIFALGLVAILLCAHRKQDRQPANAP